MIDSLILLILLISSVYFVFETISSCHIKNLENFLPCKKRNYIEEYPYIDDQKMWYSEFTNKNFIKILSKKKFTIKKEDDNKNLTTHVEDWLNGIKKLQKPKSKISIISLNRIDNSNSQYEMIIHRNGRNHGKVLKLRIK